MTTLPTNRFPGFGRASSPFEGDFFTLGAPVGPSQPNRREDVIKVETILGNTGHHDLSRTDGPLGWWGERQEKAVKAWQGDNGLKVDGLLKPNGPTISSLKRATGGLLGGFKPPSPDEVDEHHARLQQGEAGQLNTRPARLSLPKPEQPVELDEASLAFNADSARALTRSSIDGDVPRIYADYIKQTGVSDAQPTVMDLVEQVNATSGRDRADRVLHGIVGQLPADKAKALLGQDLPPARPLGVHVADLADDDTQPLFRETPRAATGDMVTGGAKTDAQPSPQANNDGKLTLPMPPPPKPGEAKPLPSDIKPGDVNTGGFPVPIPPLSKPPSPPEAGASSSQQSGQTLPSNKGVPAQQGKINSPIPNPTQREDGQGGGHFGANREGGRKHKGLDIEAAPGTEVAAPTGGKIIGVGSAYKDETKFGGEFKAVKVQGDDGRIYTMRYVSPNSKDGKVLATPGSRVEAGQVIGTVQDRARHSKGMDNHVHVEVQDKNNHIDPGPVFNPAPPRRRKK